MKPRIPLLLAIALLPGIAFAQIDPTPAEPPTDESPPPAPPPLPPVSPPRVAPRPVSPEESAPPPAPAQGDDPTAPSNEQWFPNPGPAPAPAPAPAPPPPPPPPPYSPDPADPESPAPPPPPSYSPYPSYPGARPHREDHPIYSIEAGYLSQSLYSVPINSLDIVGVLGKTIGNFGVGAIVEGAPGKTEGGLDTFTFSAGALFEGHIDRLRLGGGVNFGIFNAQRITTSDSLTTGTVSVFARGTVDLVQFGADGGLFLVGRAGFGTAGGALLGGMAGIGVRY